MTEREKLDVMMCPGQRIGAAYQKLLENDYFPSVSQEEQIRVYSLRRKSYINPALTFQQGGIEQGDILRVFHG